jgi:hypothetical protein
VIEIVITTGEPEEIAEMLRGVAEGIEHGALREDDNRIIPIWSNAGQRLGQIMLVQRWDKR